MRPADTNYYFHDKKMTLKSNLIKKEYRTNQRLGAPGVGEVGRRAAKAAWLATKAFPQAEERIGIYDLPDESEKVPDKKPKVRDEVAEVPVEGWKLHDRKGKVPVENLLDEMKSEHKKEIACGNLLLFI